MGDEIIDYARTSGGIDKIAITAAGNLLKRGNYQKLSSFLQSMDTDPREGVIQIIINKDQRLAADLMKNIMQYSSYEYPVDSFFLERIESGTMTLDEMKIGPAQTRLMSLALAVKNNHISAPNPAVQKIADNLSIKELELRASGRDVQPLSLIHI